MKSRWKILAMTAAVVLMSSFIVVIIWPMPAIDLSKDEEPFRRIAMPPQAVYGTGYMDGGSVGILVVDHVGTRHWFSFPIDYAGIRNAHPTAYSGEMNDPRMTALKNPERAKQIAIRLMDEFGREMAMPGSLSNDLTAKARRELASGPDVVAGRAYRKVMNSF